VALIVGEGPSVTISSRDNAIWVICRGHIWYTFGLKWHTSWIDRQIYLCESYTKELT